MVSTIYDADCFTDSSGTAFAELANLSEWSFYTSPFPFNDLRNIDLRRELGICLKDYCDPNSLDLARGNFLAAHYMRETRIEAKRREREEGILRNNPILREFMELPVELVLEVFSLLHPVDLFSLIRTTKSLRNLLLSKSCADVWLSVFETYEDIPPVPAGMSPPKWTTILFGPPHCDSCGLKPALVDFTYNDRVCETCSLAKTYSSWDVSTRLGAYSGGLDECYIRGSSKTNPMSYSDAHGEFSFYAARYRRDDIAAYESELSAYLDGIDSPGMEQKLRNFLSNKSRKWWAQYKLINRYSRWAQNAWESMEVAHYNALCEIKTNYQKRLMALGHDERDADVSIGVLTEVLRRYYIFKFGKRGFERCSQELEDIVRENMHVRVEEEKKTRREEVAKFYNRTVLHSMPPSLWGTLPPKAKILAQQPFCQYVENGGFGSFSTQVSNGAQLVDCFVQRWLASSEIPVFWALARAGYDVCENEVRSVISIASMSAFTCSKHPAEVLIGWDGIAQHLGCLLDDTATWNPSLSDLVFSSLGHEIISMMACHIGKTSYTALISDLDETNLVFACQDCPLIHKSKNIYGSHFFTWRQALFHGVIEKHGHRKFIPVVEETRQYMAGLQKPLPDPLEAAWVCNHCPEHRCAPVKRSNVVHHLAKWHEIRKPKSGIDALYVGSWTPPKPLFIARIPSNCLVCLLCSLAPRPKLYSESAVLMHLDAKHGLSDPIEGTHWKHLEIPAAREND
ncbi:hypothetical protein CVT24_007918 [Panaeolus cyanescens]|uniref:F-box domain-containing protein n=1 Tax=Panaeolus cyanescens TaxID=181874 RepID=A0A409W0F6_9AGAR|nr:hypothetical protein CVT24_007918 [Panaeolus cyanescens]